MSSKQIPSDIYTRSTTIKYSLLIFYYSELIDGLFVCEAASDALASQGLHISAEDIQDMITYSANESGLYKRIREDITRIWRIIVGFILFKHSNSCLHNAIYHYFFL